MTFRQAVRRHLPVRRYEAEELLESFLVSAVAAVIITRFLLRVAGWPKLGGAELHVAHLLWGGLLMMLALLLLFSSVSRLPLQVASVIGGIGFGLFIDEIGKFVTADNDYFWRPAVSLIYLVFVALYLIIRALNQRGEPRPEACLVNALELAKEAALRDLDAEEKRRTLELLGHCDPGDPLVGALRDLVQRQETVPPALPEPMIRVQAAVGRAFDRWVRAREFGVGFVAFVALAASFAVVEGILRLRAINGRTEVGIWGQFLSSSVVAALVGVGLFRFGRSRAATWRLFRVGSIVSILVVRTFAFYRNVLGATIGLTVSLLIWIFTGILLRREKRLPL